MIEAAINKILGLAKPELISVDGRQYSSRPLSPVHDPIPTALAVETLAGLLDYIRANRDHLKLDECMLIIDDYKTVRLVDSLRGAFLSRSVFITAKCERNSPNFGSYLDIEAFIIWLQSSFEDTADRAQVLSIVGNLQDGLTTNYSDDGVTQTATVKAGITKVENVSVPNPVRLKPYRTFSESVQPTSKFVFRLRSGSGTERPKAALFEADGGKWKSDAILNVRNFLELELQALNTGVVIPVIA